MAVSRARKTVRIEDLPPDVRQQLESRMEQEEAENRLRKLIQGNHRLLNAAARVDAIEQGRAGGVIQAALYGDDNSGNQP